MQTREYTGAPFGGPRSHPWSDSTTSAAFHYRDLRADPSQIRTALEDFVPWARYPAIETFYALLERLNGADSELESSDCAFTGPHANEAPAYAKALQCSGRVIVLFRELARNLSLPRMESVKDLLHRRLQPLDADFAWGLIGTTLVPVEYVALGHGYQLMISFWAWGDTEAELMGSLDRVLASLARALRRKLLG